MLKNLHVCVSDVTRTSERAHVSDIQSGSHGALALYFIALDERIRP